MLLDRFFDKVKACPETDLKYGIEREENKMINVKTFTCPLKVFHVKEQLEELDRQINSFLADNDIKNLIGVSDTCTTDDNGTSIGVIRVISYET